MSPYEEQTPTDGLSIDETPVAGTGTVEVIECYQQTQPLFIQKTDFDYFIEALCYCYPESFSKGTANKTTPEAVSYFSFTKRIVRQHSLGQELIRDLNSQAYLIGKAKEHSGELIRQPSAWMRRTFMNLCCTERKQRQRHLVLWDETYIAIPNVEVDSAVEEMHSQVETALPSLTEEEQVIVNLRFYDGLSWATIAARLGISLDAVRQRGSRARKRLRLLCHAQVEE